MRLSKIKLIGFKSFVDTTTLLFPSNRVGIIGPNGCGKSNVIDAVRWVMGESSAKQLRGSAMTDVIFNGSNTRPPANQAAIELVFEAVNQPSYPEHSEVAVKRQLSRQGESMYFINEVRCRRKDITDLFLGTGLGPRSYAIIEQGMISRLVEAKPEELRSYLEEAAGISKYKERRKETEQRIKQTQENLARLEEVRNEITQQVDKLQKQARQAEKFQELQQAVALLKAQCLALRWNVLDIAVQEQQHYLDEQTAILQENLTKLQNFEEVHKQQRGAQANAQSTLTEAQAKCYDLEGKINRFTQEITHVQERQEQLQEDLTEVEQQLVESKHTIATDEAQITSLVTKITETEIDLSIKQEMESVAEESLQEAEIQLEAWQQTWDEFNQRAALPTQTAQVERARSQNLEQQLEQTQRRLLRLEEEGRGLDVIILAGEVKQLVAELATITPELTEAEVALTAHQTQVLTLREEIQQKSLLLHDQQTQIHQLKGRLAALETLQEAALGKTQSELEAWATSQQLQTAPRLATVLQVETGWEHAVEIVLAEMLQAWCVEDLSALQTALETPPPGRLSLFEITTQTEIITTPARLGQTISREQQRCRLVQKVKAPWPLTTLFAGIWAVDTLNEAYGLRQQLAPQESVITARGIWLGPDWVNSAAGLDEQVGILAREQEIQKITQQLQVLDDLVQDLANALEQQRLALRDRETQHLELQQRVTQWQQQGSEIQAQVSGKQARLEYTKAQLQRIANEREEITKQSTEDQRELEATRHRLHAALAAMDQLADEREQLTKRRNVFQEQVMQGRISWHTIKEARHQVEVKLESLRTDQARLQQGLTRLQDQIEQLIEQRDNLQTTLVKQSTPLANWQRKLTEAEHQRTAAEANLLQAKQTVAHLEMAVNDYEGARRELEHSSQALRSTLEQVRLEWQANQVRRQTLEEQLAQTQFSPLALLAELPEGATEENWQAQIEAMERKLERIGAVNLIALQELTEQAQRKQYLDDQANDLNSALDLLENAMATMDQEIKARFEQTLNSVNQFLQEMFPKLFGGGQASLELAGQDLLIDGVVIMVQPPGKRNAHLRLLSGGEKALTAIALVFAIFQLNPAPFCMLDEVDAPLDDTNVGRFCNLVKIMSERVQFIFITHNKITMAIADQLMGVTMQEPGVSRLVTVDLNTAVDMVR